jgi:hypothetical protein
MTKRFSGRPLERSLAVINGELRCPRNGRKSIAACDACPYFCRNSRVTASLICSYPFPARDTFARRARRREDVRIALGHHLGRT